MTTLPCSCLFCAPADFLARAVIIVGLPYPNVRDQQVMLKRAHNDALLKGARSLAASSAATKSAEYSATQGGGGFSATQGGGGFFTASQMSCTQSAAAGGAASSSLFASSTSSSANDVSSVLSGSDWYALQCYRSINQALGRVIRHRWDYGAVYLVDSRYLEQQVQHSLSRWMQPSILQG